MRLKKSTAPEELVAPAFVTPASSRTWKGDRLDPVEGREALHHRHAGLEWVGGRRLRGDIVEGRERRRRGGGGGSWGGRRRCRFDDLHPPNGLVVGPRNAPGEEGGGGQEDENGPPQRGTRSAAATGAAAAQSRALPHDGGHHLHDSFWDLGTNSDALPKPRRWGS
jgi:hypothetical protein